MPIICFEPSGKSSEVEAGSRLYDAALGAGLPVASSCSGKQVCGKCNMVILFGEKNLSRQSGSEKELLLRNNKPLSERISCNTLVQGDCTVTTSYW